MVRHILAWLTILAASILTSGTAQAEDALSASDWAPDRTADQESGAVAPETPVEASPAAISDSDTPKDPSASEDTNAPPPLAPQDETPIDVDAIHLERHYLTIESLPDRDQVPMTLLDCVRTALHANQDIQVAAYNPLKAEADAFASLGEFDPLLKGSALYTRSAQSTGSDVRTYTGGVASIDAYRTSSNATLNGKLPWGTQYQASFDLGHEETTFNSFFSEYSGGMTLSLSQPLLRGRGSDYNLTRIRIAKNATQAAEDALRIQVMTSVADVIKAYWDLAGARQNVVVRRESLANAERLLDINKKRFDIGIGSSLEVIQAQAGIATRQSDYIAAISQVRDAEDRLKDLLNAERTPLLWPAEIVPVDEPSLHDIALDGEMSVKAALENRPEVHQAQVTIENAKMQEKRAGQDMQPQLNVSGSAYGGGRNHYAAKVLENTWRAKDNSYSVGMDGSVSLGNRAARGAYQKASLESREAEDRLARVKQQIILNVRLALRGVETSRILVDSTRQARALQETNVAAEEKRLKLGLSTSFEVLRTQEDLTNARTQEVQALVNHEKAATNLRLAEGVVLQHLGVTFEGVSPEQPVGFLRSLSPIPID